MDLQIKSSRVVLATESAVRKLKELKEAESTDSSFLRMGVKPGLKEAESTDSSFLRMGVKPGGCSGLSYEMFFDTEKSENDFTEEYGEVSIVVDNQSVDHIRGATLDYKEGLMETGFSIDNPNVSRTCGCGNSFS